MLYSYIGKRNTVLAKVIALETTLRKKQPDAGYFLVNEEQCTRDTMEELARGQGLFTPKSLTRIDLVLGNKETKQLVVGMLPELATSTNIFILVVDLVDTPTRKLLEKFSEKVVFVSDGVQKKEEGGTPFVFAEAFGKREGVRLWTLLVDAFERGMPAEEIHGMIFWQYRQMLFASKEKNATGAGMKPFVYTKAKQYLSNYSQAEMASMGMDLLSMNHDARRGLGDLTNALELFALLLGKKVA